MTRVFTDHHCELGTWKLPSKLFVCVHGGFKKYNKDDNIKNLFNELISTMLQMVLQCQIYERLYDDRHKYAVTSNKFPKMALHHLRNKFDLVPAGINFTH